MLARFREIAGMCVAEVQGPLGFPDRGIGKPASFRRGSFRGDSDGNQWSHEAGRPHKHLFGFRNRKKFSTCPVRQEEYTVTNEL